jgi:cell division protein DivIC
MGKNVTPMENAYVRQQELITKSAQKRRKRLIRRLTVFFLLVFTISGMLISTFLSRAEVLEQKKHEVEKMEEKLSALKKKQTVLEEEIVKLNDDDYIAKLARRDYFLSDEGEIIFNVPEAKKDKQEEESSY